MDMLYKRVRQAVGRVSKRVKAYFTGNTELGTHFLRALRTATNQYQQSKSRRREPQPLSNSTNNPVAEDQRQRIKEEQINRKQRNRRLHAD
jgi:hypothetical protein